MEHGEQRGAGLLVEGAEPEQWTAGQIERGTQVHGDLVSRTEPQHIGAALRGIATMADRTAVVRREPGQQFRVGVQYVVAGRDHRRPVSSAGYTQ